MTWPPDPNELRRLADLDGTVVVPVTQDLEEDDEGSPVGVTEVRQTPALLVIPWGHAGWPQHPDDELRSLPADPLTWT